MQRLGLGGAQCTWDERDQRFLFHVVDMFALSGNFEARAIGGQHAQTPREVGRAMARDGGGFFEPHRVEIRCYYSDEVLAGLMRYH